MQNNLLKEAFAKGLSPIVKDCFVIACIALLILILLIFIKGRLYKIASFIREHLF